MVTFSNHTVILLMEAVHREEKAISQNNFYGFHWNLKFKGVNSGQRIGLMLDESKLLWATASRPTFSLK